MVAYGEGEMERGAARETFLGDVNCLMGRWMGYDTLRDEMKTTC